MEELHRCFDSLYADYDQSFDISFFSLIVKRFKLPFFSLSKSRKIVDDQVLSQDFLSSGGRGGGAGVKCYLATKFRFSFEFVHFSLGILKK